MLHRLFFSMLVFVFSLNMGWQSQLDAQEFPPDWPRDSLATGEKRTIPHTQNIINQCLDLRSFFCTPTELQALEAFGRESVKCYGAFPNDGIDDTYSFQCAYTMAKAHGRVIFVPAGEYEISDMLNLLGVSIEGAPISRVTGSSPVNGLPGQPGIVRGSILKAADWAPSLTAVLAAATSNQNNSSTIEHLVVNANGKADYGVYVERSTLRNTTFNSITALGALTAGFYFEQCQIMSAVHLKAYGNWGDGFHFYGSNAAKFLNLSAHANLGVGVVVRPGQTGPGSGGVELSGRSEDNNGGAVLVSGTSSPVVIRDFWMEGNLEDTVKVENAEAVFITRNLIISRSNTPHPMDATNRAIRIVNSRGVIVNGNSIVDGKGNAGNGWTSGFARVRFEGVTTGNAVEHTFYNSPVIGGFPVPVEWP